MHNVIKPGFPFTLSKAPSSTQLYDSLRLGKRIEELRTVCFHGFQSDGKEVCGSQMNLRVEPKGLTVIDDPEEEGGEAIYFWGKCVTASPTVGPDQGTHEFTDFVFGRVNLTHGRGTLNFSGVPVGMEFPKK